MWIFISHNYSGVHSCSSKTSCILYVCVTYIVNFTIILNLYYMIRGIYLKSDHNLRVSQLAALCCLSKSIDL